MSTPRQPKAKRNDEGREERRLAARCEALEEQVEALERARAELCSVLSHDLRNPLTVILWSAQGLARHLPADHPGRRQLEAMRRASDELSQMLDDLSDASRVRDGRLRLSLDTHAVASLVDAAVVSIRALREAKELTVDIQLADVLGAVRCDGDRVTGVIAHLLARAARVTPKHAVISLRAEPLAGGGVRVSVDDMGPPLTGDERASFFDLPAGQPIDEPRRPWARGPGLALFAAAGIAEAHGGRLAIEDAPTGGSRFVLSLPGSVGDEITAT
jgi:K+-sensing histidine kinase KdpD